jgi:hypothetical protein
MAIKNINGYHRLGFAYLGNESIARIVVETWKNEEARLTTKSTPKTYEFDKTLLNYEKTADYVMYNFDKTKENCDERFVTACYEYIKTLEGYEDCEDIDIDNTIVIDETEKITKISKDEFLERFTFEELNAIANYETLITGEEAVEVLEKKMAMKTLWERIDGASEVNLASSKLITDFVQIVYWTGLIAIDRLIEIAS